MKMKKILVGTVFLIGLFTAKAQEETTYSDEELFKYATVMVWAEAEKGKMADSVEVWVKSNDKLSASAYNELSRASKNGTVDEVDLSDEEKAVFVDIQNKIEEQKEVFKEIYVGKIKNDIGAGLYNGLKKAMRSDTDLKERYQEIYDGLLSEENGGDENESVEGQ